MQKIETAHPALALESQYYHVIFDQSPIAYVIWDRDLIVREWNRAAERIFGWSRDEMIGVNIFTALVPDSAVIPVDLIIKQLINQQFANESINDNLTKDRGIITCHWHNKIITDANGDFQNVLSMVQDVTEQVRAERNLRESEQMLKAVLDTIPVRVFWKDRNSRYLGCNHLFASDAGKESPDEIVARTDQELFPSQAEMYRIDDAHVIETEEVRLNYEEPQTTPDGSTLWLRTSKVPLRNTAGDVIGVLGTYEDITEKKRAEVALRESEQMLKAVLDTIPVRVFWKDRASRYLGCNHLFAADAGKESPDEIVAKTDYEIFPSQAELYRSDDAHVILTEAVRLNYEEPQTTPDGSTIWLRTSKVPLRNSGGEIIGVLGTYEDVTEKKRAEVALRESERRLRAIIDNAPVIFFSLDKNGKFTLSEGKALASLGLKPGQVVGMSAFDLYADNPSIISATQRALKGEALEYDTDAGGVWFNTRYTPILDEAGNFEYVLGLALDITDRKHAERERERLIRELEEALIFKDQFLATMSHELRTPLNAVLGYAGIAGMQYELPLQVEHMLARIKMNSQRLLSLINDILDISRINAKRVEIVQRPFDTEDAARGWYEDFKQTATEKQLEFVFDYDPTLPRLLIGDQERLAQIAHNLLNNAMKFTERGKIELRVRRDGDTQWQISVVDTGVGIPDTWQHLIFEEFRQVDGSSRRKYGGAGLGLSIVQKLCQLMDGSVQVSSKVGEGSTFTVTLPLRAAETAEIAQR